MKHTQRYVSFLLVLVMSFLCAALLMSTASAEASASDITQYSLTLDDSIAINFYVTLAPADASDARLCFENGTEIPVGEAVKKGDAFVFSYTGITPQYMDVPVVATLKNGETVLDTATASAADYCEGVLASADAAYASVKPIAAALLSYADASRAYAVAVDPTGESIGKDVTAPVDPTYPTVSEMNVPVTASLSGTCADLSVDGAGLILGDRVELYFAYTAPAEHTPSVKIGETAVSASVSDTRVTVALSASQLFEPVTLSFADCDVTATYSAANYMKSKKDVSENGLGTLVKMLYAYADAVQTYLHPHTHETATATLSEDMKLTVTCNECETTLVNETTTEYFWTFEGDEAMYNYASSGVMSYDDAQHYHVYNGSYDISLPENAAPGDFVYISLRIHLPSLTETAELYLMYETDAAFSLGTVASQNSWIFVGGYDTELQTSEEEFVWFTVGYLYNRAANTVDIYQSGEKIGSLTGNAAMKAAQSPVGLRIVGAGCGIDVDDVYIFSVPLS